MENQKTFRDFFIDQLKDLYSIEKQLCKAIPELIQSTSSPELQKALEEHLEETKNHVDRLEVIGKKLEKNLTDKKCLAMEAIIKEGSSIIDEDIDANVLDAAIITAAQKAEHYEIASYGSALAFANILGEDEIVELLDQTLEEEKEADEILTGLSDEINAIAAGTEAVKNDYNMQDEEYENDIEANEHEAERIRESENMLDSDELSDRRVTEMNKNRDKITTLEDDEDVTSYGEGEEDPEVQKRNRGRNPL